MGKLYDPFIFFYDLNQLIIYYRYLENSRFIEAEEIGNRAVEKTRGRDAWALHTLANTFNMTGRSSEAQGIIDKYQDKHEGNGLLLLLCNKALSLVQKGNYSLATRTVEQMLDIIKLARKKNIISVSNASLILWQIGLNSTHYDSVHYLYRSLRDILSYSVFVHQRIPINDFFTCLTLSSASFLEESLENCFSRNSDVGDGILHEHLNKRKSVFAEITQFWGEKLKAIVGKNSDASKSKATQSNSLSGQQKLDSDNLDLQTTPFGNAFLGNFEEYMKFLGNITKVDDSINNADDVLISDFTNLSDMIDQRIRNCFPDSPFLSHDLKLLFDYDDDLADLSVSNYTTVTNSTTIPLARLFRSFCEGDFQSSAAGMTAFRSAIRKLGGVCIQRDIIEITIIEAFLRSGNFDTARVLLCERYVDRYYLVLTFLSSH